MPGLPDSLCLHRPRGSGGGSPGWGRDPGKGPAAPPSTVSSPQAARGGTELPRLLPGEPKQACGGAQEALPIAPSSVPFLSLPLPARDTTIPLPSLEGNLLGHQECGVYTG